MKRLLLSLSALLCLLVPVATVSAAGYNPLTQACQAPTTSGQSVSGTATACSASTSDPITGPNGILKKVSLVLAIIAGIAAVIIIIFGGFRYITSGGDPKKAADARSSVTGAAIGLVIITAAETIVIFVVSKL